MQGRKRFRWVPRLGVFYFARRTSHAARLFRLVSNLAFVLYSSAFLEAIAMADAVVAHFIGRIFAWHGSGSPALTGWWRSVWPRALGVRAIRPAN